MKAWLPAASADIFQHHLHEMICDHGGAGSVGSVTLRLDGDIDLPRLAEAWITLQRRCPLLGAKPGKRRGHPGWIIAGGRPSALVRGSIGLGDLDPLRVRLGCVGRAVTLLFDHRICDERAAEEVLAAIGLLAAGRPAVLDWADPAARELDGLPAGWLQRASAMHPLRAALRPLRLAPAWRPLHDQAAAPMVWHDLILAGDVLSLIVSNQLAEIGRFGRSFFLLAAIARALDQHGASGRQQLFALALDDRPPSTGALLANRHALALLALGAGERDSRMAAAQAAQAALRTWVRSRSDRAMAAALRVSPWLSRRWVRAQLGRFAGGVDATCLLSHVGKLRIPEVWLDCRIIDITRRVAIPHTPGLVVLSGEDPRGWCLSIGMTASVARSIPPVTLAEAITLELTRAP
jgi:hypothetical protein